MIHVVLENAYSSSVLLSTNQADNVAVLALQQLNKDGILKVFQEKDLMLVIHLDKLKKQDKISAYSELQKAVKRYDLNVFHNVFCPTIEI